ncbi:MAG: glycosyltransferase, partial [Candidatus Komeilibacteria bacterium]|nr:glycosyltransferase [Candidatus Komeilibacteria bacterium]
TVASNVGEEKFSISSGVNGLLVENNPSDWVEAILRLTTDFELRKTISQNAQKTIEENYSYQSQIQKYHKLFENFLHP